MTQEMTDEDKQEFMNAGAILGQIHFMEGVEMARDRKISEVTYSALCIRGAAAFIATHFMRVEPEEIDRVVDELILSEVAKGVDLAKEVVAEDG